MFVYKTIKWMQPFPCPPHILWIPRVSRGSCEVLGRLPSFQVLSPKMELSSLTPFFLSCHRSNSQEVLLALLSKCIDNLAISQVHCRCGLSYQHLSPGSSQLPPKWSSSFCPCSLPLFSKLQPDWSCKTEVTLSWFPCKPLHHPPPKKLKTICILDRLPKYPDRLCRIHLSFV